MNKKFELVDKKLDYIHILEKLEEIDKLKIILFNKYELKLMKLLPKRKIYNYDNICKIEKYYSILNEKEKLSKTEFEECMKKKFKINQKLIKLIKI